MALLNGCERYRPGPVILPFDHEVTMTTCGTMPCTAPCIGPCVQARGPIVCWLESHGVNVIQVGDYVKLVLPSDCVFIGKTPIMNPAYYPVLNRVGDFICCPEKMTVKISGYTDNCGPCLRNLALSRQQAQAVTDYLWRYGTDTRTMYSSGYGECDPIACNNSAQGRAHNRRIEITLRRITDYYDY